MPIRYGDSDNPPFGWMSTVRELVGTEARVVVSSLERFIGEIHDAKPGYLQRDAWNDYVPTLQSELKDTIGAVPGASEHLALLEYRFEFDGRRPDFLLLSNGVVVVVEFKKKAVVAAADLDQVMAYARDLKGYHKVCHGRTVIPVLVPTKYKGPRKFTNEVWVCEMTDLDPLIREFEGFGRGDAIDPAEFISSDAYVPLPSLVMAAREVFEKHAVRHVSHAYANTEPAVECVRGISVHAANTKSRHIVLVTGVPGAGKTLVGLRAVHEGHLETLRTSQDGAPAVFLSGNAPLVTVLKYVIRSSPGGDSALASVFVQDVKKFRERYVKPGKRPNQHIIVSDEAQRAWDAAKMLRAGSGALSEPSVFVEIASQVPDWSVFVGLVGNGQEIHDGEEGGVEQWFDAVAARADRAQWTLHVPPALEPLARLRGLSVNSKPALSLDREIRFHKAEHLSEWVQGLLGIRPPEDLKPIADALWRNGFRMYVTHHLQEARDYLTNRYEGFPGARFGIVASSRDKELSRHGIPNGYLDAERVKLGPWYVDPIDYVDSCCRLTTCVTEFKCQGLELDAAIVGWGTDFVWNDGNWSIEGMKPYQRPRDVQDPHQLRTNAYRVLLTRGRDGFVIFCPRVPALEGTVSRLVACGVRPLPAASELS